MEPTNLAHARARVRAILEDPPTDGWTLRFFGQILQRNLGEKLSLHVFYPRDGAPEEAHSHGVSWVSTVIAGRIVQRRYRPADADAPGARRYRTLTDRLTVDPRDAEDAWLVEGPEEVVSAGESYSSTADDIHRTTPQRGTVTLLRWGDEPWTPDATYWDPEAGRPWAYRTEEPTPEDVARFCAAALAVWNAPRLDAPPRRCIIYGCDEPAFTEILFALPGGATGLSPVCGPHAEHLDPPAAQGHLDVPSAQTRPSAVVRRPSPETPISEATAAELLIEVRDRIHARLDAGEEASPDWTADLRRARDQIEDAVSLHNRAVYRERGVFAITDAERLPPA